MTTNQAIIEALNDILKETAKLSQSIDRLLLETKSTGKHAKEAHEYTTGKYSWQVSVRDEPTLRVSAYPFFLNSEGDVVGWDSTECLTLYIPMDVEHVGVVAYLLETTDWMEAPDWNTEAWAGYGDWVEEEFLSCKEAPAVVQAFVKSVNQLSHKEFTRVAKESKND